MENPGDGSLTPTMAGMLALELLGAADSRARERVRMPFLSAAPARGRAPSYVAAAAVLVGLGATQLGCSGSSSGGGAFAPASTTAASTSGAQPAATPPVTPPIPQAPASQGQPLDVLNQDLQTLWDRLRPDVLAQLGQLVTTQLAGKTYGSSTISVEVRAARLGPTTSLATAPGFLRLDTNRLEVRAPLSGGWTLAIECDLRVRLSVGSVSPTLDFPVTLVLDDLSLVVHADIDDSDPTRPVLRQVGQPQLSFQLRLDSTNPLAQQLTGVLTQPANWLAQQALASVLASLTPQLAGIQGIPGAIPGDGAPPLTDSGAATPFEAVALQVDLKLRAVNSPHGTVLRAYMDQPSGDSWLTAYGPNGPGNPGQVVDYEDGGDSAIWTGHYLASQAFRWAVTQDPLALDNIGHTLQGIGALLDVNGGTGLLARCAAPERSIVGQNLIAHGRVFRSAQLRGETWVGQQGGNGISRDQYSGVMFGLSICWELVPAARPDCELRIRQILDYLIANDWIITEDRPAQGQNGSRGATFWTTNFYQKLAFLLIGYRFDQARYGPHIARSGATAELAWLSAWTGVMGLDHYYKYNLSAIGYYNYFRLETDPTRWQHMRRAEAIVERYVGHHQNPHFDLIHASFDPATQAVKFPCVREALRRFLDMNHRQVAPPVIDLSGVTWVTLPQFGYTNTPGGGFALTSTTHTFPAAPLDPVLRGPTDFQWQRDPFSPATPNQGDPRLERVGVDLLLPYWMGRYMGAF